jgi:hypothetical protein
MARAEAFGLELILTAVGDANQMLTTYRKQLLAAARNETSRAECEKHKKRGLIGGSLWAFDFRAPVRWRHSC